MRANVVCPGFVHTPLRSRHASGHPSICWAKFEATAEGARRATKIPYGCA